MASACVGPDYHPRKGAGLANTSWPHGTRDATYYPGYSETRLAPDRYRVYFLGAKDSTSERDRDLNLLRAAEVCLEQGYTHFSVTERVAARSGIVIQLHRAEPLDGERYQASLLVASLREKYALPVYSGPKPS